MNLELKMLAEEEFRIVKWQEKHLMPLDSLSKKIPMEFMEKVKQIGLGGTPLFLHF